MLISRIDACAETGVGPIGLFPSLVISRIDVPKFEGRVPRLGLLYYLVGFIFSIDGLLGIKCPKFVGAGIQNVREGR